MNEGNHEPSDGSEKPIEGSANQPSGEQFALEHVTHSAEILVRYHLERRDFFSTISKLSDFLVILLGMGVTASFASSSAQGEIQFGHTLGFLAALIAAFSLVVSPAALAEKHNQSAKNFLKLKKELDFGFERRPVNQVLAEFHDLRAENPPTFQAVYLLSRNLTNSQRFDDAWITDIPLWRSLFRNVLKQAAWIPPRPTILKRSPY